MSDDMEEVESFRARAKSWISTNLPPADDQSATEHELQAQLFDAGFSGIAFPREFGGAGLTFAHQKAFYEEAAGHRTPFAFGVSIGMLGATLLEVGSETLKERHLPAILRGDEEWIQLLSEPTGGSDMAGALTDLSRDGDVFRLNGSKMWSTGADKASHGMCLARTNWDVPKHRGLSMVVVPLKKEGVTIQPILPVDGSGVAHFFTEFFDDVELPVDHLIGEENDGWRMAQTLLFYERNATAGIGHGIGLMGMVSGQGSDRFGFGLIRRSAERRSVTQDPSLRQILAQSYIEQEVARAANDRVMSGMRTGALQGHWGSLLKLNVGMNATRQAKISLAVSGPDGVIWEGEELARHTAGTQYLNSRTVAISGGSNEIQRNIVSERLLGLPREPAIDLDIPFRDVLRSRQNKA